MKITSPPTQSERLTEKVNEKDHTVCLNGERSTLVLCYFSPLLCVYLLQVDLSAVDHSLDVGEAEPLLQVLQFLL